MLQYDKKQTKGTSHNMRTCITNISSTTREMVVSCSIQQGFNYFRANLKRRREGSECSFSYTFSRSDFEVTGCQSEKKKTYGHILAIFNVYNQVVLASVDQSCKCASTTGFQDTCFISTRNTADPNSAKQHNTVEVLNNAKEKKK